MRTPRVRFWRQVWLDFANLLSHLPNDKMKAISTLILLIVLAGGVSYVLTLDWWLKPLQVQPLRISVVAGLVLVLISFWFGSAFTRSRQPVLTVSNLKAESVSGVFQMRVENKGPGRVTPIVTVVYLRDLQGRHLQFDIKGFKGPLPISYAGYEAFWRSCGAGKRPVLTEGHPLYAGPLLKSGADLMAHSLNGDLEKLRAAGVRLQITATYEPVAKDVTPPVIKHSYILAPNQESCLEYEVQRVRLRSLFWR